MKSCRLIIRRMLSHPRSARSCSVPIRRITAYIAFKTNSGGRCNYFNSSKFFFSIPLIACFAASISGSTDYNFSLIGFFFSSISSFVSFSISPSPLLFPFHFVRYLSTTLQRHAVVFIPTTYVPLLLEVPCPLLLEH